MKWVQRLFLTMVMFGFCLIPLSFKLGDPILLLAGLAMIFKSLGLEYYYEEKNSW